MRHPVTVLFLAIAADLCHQAWQVYIVPVPHYLLVALLGACAFFMACACVLGWLVLDFLWGLVGTVAAERRERA